SGGLEPAEAGRVEGLARELADGSLEEMVDPDVPAGDLVCLRRVTVPPIRCRADAPDREVLERLSRAIAAAIEAAATTAGPDVVRYRNRAHALADLVVSMARGDRRRAWVWRQLDMWPSAGATEVEADPRSAVAGALAAEPFAVPAVLAVAANEDVIHEVVGLLGPETLEALARAAWLAGGTALASWPELLARAPREEASVLRGAELLARVPLGRAVLGAPGWPPSALLAAAALALLDAEPSLAAEPAEAVLDVVA